MLCPTVVCIQAAIPVTVLLVPARSTAARVDCTGGDNLLNRRVFADYLIMYILRLVSEFQRMYSGFTITLNHRNGWWRS